MFENTFKNINQEKLPALLPQKYQALEDDQTELGDVAQIRSTFIEFQKYLYAKKVA